MFSQSQIMEMSRKAGRDAARAHRTPLLWEAGDTLDHLRRMPNLGDHRPKGWKLLSWELVDSSGFGAEDEPALTPRQLLAWVKPGHGYAIIEQGQFQVVVGEFKKTGRS